MNAETKIVCILAGGQSQRMNSDDKATIDVAGIRIIDRVLARLANQADLVLIAGPDDRQTGRPIIPDLPDAPGGPVGALASIMHWLKQNAKDVGGFYTVPVDAPLLPKTLVSRLGKAKQCAIAVDKDGGKHPTFAHWRVEALEDALSQSEARNNQSLHNVAALCSAALIPFDNVHLTNINSPADLEMLYRDHRDRL